MTHESQFQIYSGKVGNTEVIKDLSRELVGKKHKVYFTSSILYPIKKTFYNEIYACETARKNRKQMLPDLQDDKQLRHGDSDYIQRTSGPQVKGQKNSTIHF